MNNAATRQQQLELWAREVVLAHWGQDPGPVQGWSPGGDASFRRYFRFSPGLDMLPASLMLVDAPPQKEDNPAFIRAAAEFAEAGLCTPHIYASDLEHGFLVLEDFGDQLFLPCLQTAQQAGDTARIDTLYNQASQALLMLQSHPAPSQLPAYDRELLHRELCLFDDWFCAQMLGLQLSVDEKNLLADTWRLLEDSALQQPQVRVHRDFHSRNLMVRPDSQGHLAENQAPGIIDFQDAVIGPASYDLVSLLRDCYIVWPQSDVRRWALSYHGAAQSLGILPDAYGENEFLRDFDLMGLQRHIKVLGIFCRLALRDHKPRYLDDLPVVMDYVCQVASRHPCMFPFLQWFQAGPLVLMQRKLAELRT